MAVSAANTADKRAQITQLDAVAMIDDLILRQTKEQGKKVASYLKLGDHGKRRGLLMETAPLNGRALVTSSYRFD
jgi:hypothetical protein